MQIRWSDAGRASARRFMRDDQDGLREVGLYSLTKPPSGEHPGGTVPAQGGQS
jgi:hypothetical protein